MASLGPDFPPPLTNGEFTDAICGAMGKTPDIGKTARVQLLRFGLQNQGLMAQKLHNGYLVGDHIKKCSEEFTRFVNQLQSFQNCDLGGLPINEEGLSERDILNLQIVRVIKCHPMPDLFGMSLAEAEVAAVAIKIDEHERRILSLTNRLFEETSPQSQPTVLDLKDAKALKELLISESGFLMLGGKPTAVIPVSWESLVRDWAGALPSKDRVHAASLLESLNKVHLNEKYLEGNSPVSISIPIHDAPLPKGNSFKEFLANRTLQQITILLNILSLTEKSAMGGYLKRLFVQDEMARRRIIYVVAHLAFSYSQGLCPFANRQMERLMRKLFPENSTGERFVYAVRLYFDCLLRFGVQFEYRYRVLEIFFLTKECQKRNELLDNFRLAATQSAQLKSPKKKTQAVGPLGRLESAIKCLDELDQVTTDERQLVGLGSMTIQVLGSLLQFQSPQVSWSDLRKFLQQSRLGKMSPVGLIRFLEEIVKNRQQPKDVDALFGIISTVINKLDPNHLLPREQHELMCQTVAKASCHADFESQMGNIFSHCVADPSYLRAPLATMMIALTSPPTHEAIAKLENFAQTLIDKLKPQQKDLILQSLDWIHLFTFPELKSYSWEQKHLDLLQQIQQQYPIRAFQFVLLVLEMLHSEQFPSPMGPRPEMTPEEYVEHFVKMDTLAATPTDRFPFEPCVHEPRIKQNEGHLRAVPNSDYPRFFLETWDCGEFWSVSRHYVHSVDTLKTASYSATLEIDPNRLESDPKLSELIHLAIGASGNEQPTESPFDIEWRKYARADEEKSALYPKIKAWAHTLNVGLQRAIRRLPQPLGTWTQEDKDLEKEAAIGNIYPNGLLVPDCDGLDDTTPFTFDPQIRDQLNTFAGAIKTGKSVQPLTLPVTRYPTNEKLSVHVSFTPPSNPDAGDDNDDDAGPIESYRVTMGADHLYFQGKKTIYYNGNLSESDLAPMLFWHFQMVISSCYQYHAYGTI